MRVLILQKATTGRALLVMAILVMAAQITLGQTVLPEIKDPKEVTVTFKRSGGLSRSPSYKLIISGDGSVHYQGYGNVFTKGKRVGHLSNSQMIKLIQAFRNSGFFELQAEYLSSATDLPGCSTEFRAGSLRKRVVDYGISLSGAPQSLIELENRIDEIAGSRKWVKGSLLRRLLHWH